MINPFSSIGQLIENIKSFSLTDSTKRAVTIKPPDFGIRLYEILNKLTKNSGTLQDTVDTLNPIILFHEIRLELPGIRITINDVLPIRRSIKFPLDASNNLLIGSFNITYLSITAKTLAVNSDYIVDILVSVDKGVTWKSLFAPTNVNKPTLKIGVPQTDYSRIFKINQLFDGNMLRVDELQTDGIIAGVELTLLGNLSLP